MAADTYDAVICQETSVKVSRVGMIFRIEAEESTAQSIEVMLWQVLPDSAQ